MNEQIPQEVEAARRETRRAAADVVWYAALSLILVGVVFVGAVSAAAVSPRYCATCHGKVVGLAAAGPHAGVACASCHARPGVLGLAEQRAEVVGMVPARLVGSPDRASGRVYDAQCLRCHGAQIRGVVTSSGLRMSHREVIAAGWACARCHGATGHGAAVTAFRSQYDMDACLECHSQNPRDIDACQTCHVDGGSSDRASLQYRTPWRVTHGPGWQQLHGMGNLRTCAACHQASKCIECHHMQIPHPAGFKKSHGADMLARANGRADCVVCHQGSSCDDCHGVEMPHPSGFLQEHRAVVERSGKAVCSRCHDAMSCDACHARHVHPGIPPETLKQLKARPVQ